MLSILKKLLARLVSSKPKAPAKQPAKPLAPPRPAPPQYPDQIDFDNSFDDETTDDFLERQRQERERLAPRMQPDSRVPWESKYPEFALESGRPVAIEGADDAYQDEHDESPWLVAPENSHVWGMRYTDRKNVMSRAMLGRDDDERVGTERFDENTRHRAGVPGLLHVRFKGSNRWGVRGYTYRFTDADEGKRVFDMMANSDHPGEVVWSELIRKRVPYRREI